MGGQRSWFAGVRHRVWGRGLTVSTAMLGALVMAVPFAAADSTVGPFHNKQALWSKVAIKPAVSQTGTAYHATVRTVQPKGFRALGTYTAQATSWPAASTSTVALTRTVAAPTTPSTASAGASATASSGSAAPTSQLQAVTAPVRAGSSPVTVAPAPGTATSAGKPRSFTSAAQAQAAGIPTKVQVQVQSHAQAVKAGVNGMLVGVGRADGASGSGKVAIRIDYSSLAKAYGGDWASRLYLVSYPSCILTTPQVAGCHKATPLASGNQLAARSLTATVTLPAASPTATTSTSTSGGVQAQARGLAVTTAAQSLAAVAVVGSTGGSQGSYAASNIATSAGSWASSGTGAFTYAYPIDLPPSLGGTAPSVALNYDSQSVDGETAARDSQASWIGDGWSYSPGFIQQSFRPCATDGVDALKKSGDQCWGGFNGTISFDGHNGVLVPVGGADASTGIVQVFKLQNDDGTLVQELSGATNGLNNGTYFKVTTTSGATAYFGLNHAPSAAGGVGTNTDAATNSAWGMPVYCPNTGDPCYSSSTGTASHATMGYRYNLDFTLDLHSNLQRLDYTAETGYYNMGAGQASDGKGDVTDSGYTRGGYLTKISYGYQLADEIAKKNPAAEVDFATAARCNATGCGYSTLTPTTAPSWPDVPYDLNCNQSDSNDTTIGLSGPAANTCYTVSPTFWSEARLDSITTKIRVSGALKTVDTYQLTQTYSDTGNNDPVTGTTVDPADAASLQAVLWLKSIQHTGNDTTAGATTTAQLNPVNFIGTEIDNRSNDDMTGSTSSEVPLYRPRISSIQTETGGTIAVTYNTPSCAGANTPTAPASNTSLCYPVYWSNPGAASPHLEYFNKTTVKTVSAGDMVAGSPTQVTNYSYSSPAWHRDDSQLTDDQYRTWDQFHGFHQVTVTTGDPGSTQVLTQSTTTYLQGMNGDYKADGTQRQVSVDAYTGGNQTKVATVTDSSYLTGRPLQTDTYTQAGGTVVATAITETPTVTTEGSQTRTAWTSQSPAPATLSTLPDLTAYRSKTTSTSNYALLANKTWRHTQTVTGYDDQGRAVSVDAKGDLSDSSQEKCTTTAYATAPAANPMMLAYPQETVTVAGACPTSGLGGSSTHPALSDTRTYYDGNGTITTPGTLGTLGTHADVTATALLTSYSGTTAVFTTESASTYDAYGRITKTLDANSKATTTAFASVTGELPTAMQSVNSQSWKTTSTLDPLRGIPTENKDANNALTDITYDALGRRTQVWLPGHTKSANATTPDEKFAYAINPGAQPPDATGHINTPGAPTSVTTQTLREDGTYSTSVTIYDGLLQQRETQSNSGSDTSMTTTDRLVSDTQYDTHGWPVFSYPTYYDASTGPSSTLSVLSATSAQAQNVTVYDGLGRVTNSQLYHQGIQQWQSTTSYPGADETDTTAPAGGPGTATFTNALGQTTASTVKDTAATVALNPGQIIPSGTSLTSASVRLAMGADGNLVLSSLTSGATLWSSSTTGNPGAWATFQADGNFVVYDAGRTKALWSSGTTATGGTLKLQNDANLVLYDSSGNSAWSTSTSGKAAQADATASYTYTPAGQVATIKDTAGNTWSYSYNLLGQKTSQTDPNVGTSSYGPYDNQGNLEQATDARGQTLSYHYDWDNRLTSTYTGAYTTTPVAANQLTASAYDSLAKGYPTSTTRYVGGSSTTGKAYTQAVTGYNAFYEPTGSYESIPSSDGYTQPTLPAGLTPPTGQTVFLTTPSYSSNTGLLGYTQYYNDGGLPQEQVGYAYNLQGELVGEGSSTNASYINQVVHDGYGHPIQTIYGAVGEELTTGATYDPTTMRLAETSASLQGPNNIADDTNYRYNQAGGLTAIDNSQVSAGIHDTQCFSYDSLQRLTQAWSDTAGITNPTSGTVGSVGGCNTSTPTTTATAPITTTTVGGPAAYWQTYTYDLLGDRTGTVNHDTTGNAAKNTTQTTTYPGANATTTATHPNQAGTTTITNPTTGTSTLTPGYLEPDGTTNAGNTTSLAATGTTGTPIPTGTTQKITYDAEGRTASVTTGTGTTAQTSSYLYDASGSLLEQTGNGTKILYLFGGAEQITQYTANGNTAVNALRFYPGPDGTTITRDQSGNLNYQLSLGQGTGTELINASTDAITRRYYDPYGNPRGTTPTTWGDKSNNLGFLNKPTDTTTGLDQLGARNYSPVLGRFLSPDPIFEAGDPNQMGGYTYAADNPASGSDPSGLYDPDGRGYTYPGMYIPPANDGGDLGNIPGNLAKGAGETLAGAADATVGQVVESFTSVSTGVTNLPHNAVAGVGAPGLAAPPAVAPLERPMSKLFHANPNSTGYQVGYWGATVVSLAPVAGDAAGAIGAALDSARTARAADDAGVAASFKSLVTRTRSDANAYTDTTTGVTDASSPAAGASGSAEDAGICVGGCKCSFSPDTPVLMANGTTTPIAKLKNGDKVESADPSTGKDQGGRFVQHVWINKDNDLLDITVNTGHGHTATIHTTSNHPFWDDTTHTWAPAGQLKPGHKLASTSTQHPTVVAVTATPGTANRYNLTIQQLHTYYVLAGTTPILVHNANKCVAVNDAGRFGDLNPGQVGDGLEAHHMPQDGLGFLTRNEGGAIVMTQADHALTRTYKSLGRATKAAESGLPFRTVLARDIWDLRGIGQQQYGDPGYFNSGIQGLLAYYRRIGML